MSKPYWVYVWDSYHHKELHFLVDRNLFGCLDIGIVDAYGKRFLGKYKLGVGFRHSGVFSTVEEAKAAVEKDLGEETVEKGWELK